MQDANGRQYKREMASFEVGSENAMAGSVLRDERAPRRKEDRRDSGDEGHGRLARLRRVEKERCLSRTKWR